MTYQRDILACVNLLVYKHCGYLIKIYIRLAAGSQHVVVQPALIHMLQQQSLKVSHLSDVGPGI